MSRASIWDIDERIVEEKATSFKVFENMTIDNEQGTDEFLAGMVGLEMIREHIRTNSDLTEQQALEMAISTWPDGIIPATHYSESRSKEYNDDKIRPQAHSDYVYDKIETYGNDIDVMVEAKHKELAVQKYKELHLC